MRGRHWFGASVAAFIVALPSLAAESDVLLSPAAEARRSLDEKGGAESVWTYSPSGGAVFRFEGLGERRSPLLEIDHRAFPASSAAPAASAEDHSLNLQYRSRILDRGFFQGRSTIDETGFGPYSSGYRQVLGYGLRVLDRRTVTFDIVPGVVGDYSREGPLEERLNWMGNLNQNLSWEVHDGFVLNQNFNTTLERTERDNLSAVLNLDLETLFADRLSFKLSYEVHYDDSLGDEMEKRDSRLATSVGFRF
jgi:hypothetical protein